MKTKERIIVSTVYLLVSLTIFFGSMYMHDRNKKTTPVNQNFSEVEMDPVINPQTDNLPVIDENTIIIATYIYQDCPHSEVEVINPSPYIGLNQAQFADWVMSFSIISFTSNKIELEKQYSNKCSEHYVVRINGDKLGVFYQNDPEMLYQELNINVNSLTSDDKIEFETGVYLESNDELLELTENYVY